MSKRPPPEAKTPKRKTITSLAQFQAEVSKAIKIEFLYRGQPFEVEARKLCPAEEARCDEYLNAVIPPIIRGKTIEEDRPDFSAPDYVKAKAKAELMARAIGLYLAVPIFQKEKPNLQTDREILEFVQSKLDDQILNMMWQAVRHGGVSMAELVNFS